MDERVRQVTEVVDVQDGAMHDVRILTDGDASGTSVQVGSLVKIAPITKVYVVGIAETNATLDGGHTIHMQDRPIEYRPEPNADDARDPSGNGHRGLFEYIAPQAARLSADIQSQV
jgi:hypothetical protein